MAGAGPVDSLTWIAPGIVSSPVSWVAPREPSISEREAASVIALSGCRIVVSDGEMSIASAMSSHPATESAPGMLIPIRVATRTTPAAIALATHTLAKRMVSWPTGAQRSCRAGARGTLRSKRQCSTARDKNKNSGRAWRSRGAQARSPRIS